MLEGVNDEELLQQARQHTQDDHPDEDFDEDGVRELIARAGR